MYVFLLKLDVIPMLHENDEKMDIGYPRRHGSNGNLSMCGVYKCMIVIVIVIVIKCKNL